MKKVLIGNCPVCACKHTVCLSPILEIPIGSSRQCYSCFTTLRVMPATPILKEVVDFGSYVGVLVWIVLGHSVVTPFYAVTVYFVWSFVIGDLVGRRFWKPVLVVAGPKSTVAECDFLSEETSAESSGTLQKSTKKQNKS